MQAYLAMKFSGQEDKVVEYEKTSLFRQIKEYVALKLRSQLVVRAYLHTGDNHCMLSQSHNAKAFCLRATSSSIVHKYRSSTFSSHTPIKCPADSSVSRLSVALNYMNCPCLSICLYRPCLNINCSQARHRIEDVPLSHSNKFCHSIPVSTGFSLRPANDKYNQDSEIVILMINTATHNSICCRALLPSRRWFIA